MEKALGLRGPMFSTALKTPGLKIVMGTDAVAGAHGQNAREPIERVKTGQKPMDAIIGMTALAAESMGLQQGARRDRGRPQRRPRRDRRRSAPGHHGAAACAVRNAQRKGLQTLTISDLISDCGSIADRRLMDWSSHEERNCLCRGTVGGRSDPDCTVSGYHVRSGRVIVGDGRVIDNASVVVKGTRITQVGAASIIKAPAGATRVSLAGKTVMPAIVDAHVHTSTTAPELETDLRRRAHFG